MTAPRRPAPAFQLEVRAPLLWRALALLLWGCAAVALCAALAAQAGQRLGPRAEQACWAGVALALPALAWWAWRRRVGPSWQLLWDGRQWSLRPGGAHMAAARDEPRQPVEVQVAMDLDSFLLLRCHPGAGEAWRPSVFLPLLRRQHPADWQPLRWALFSARVLPGEPP